MNNVKKQQEEINKKLAGLNSFRFPELIFCLVVITAIITTPYKAIEHYKVASDYTICVNNVPYRINDVDNKTSLKPKFSGLCKEPSKLTPTQCKNGVLHIMDAQGKKSIVYNEHQTIPCR